MPDHPKGTERAHCETHQRLRGHKRNWLRHTAMVPKGFIRFKVLEALKEKPMSGSELMEQIEKHVGGFWKPSPGSIYPLLSWLQDSGYIKELPTENGMKRYELTQSGKSLLDEQKNIMKKFRDTMGFPQPPFATFLSKIPSEKAVEIGETMRRAGAVMLQLASTLHEHYSEEAVNQALKVVEEAAVKLEEITKNLEGEVKND